MTAAATQIFDDIYFTTRDGLRLYGRHYKADGSLNKTDAQGPVADNASYDLLGVFVQDTLPLFHEAIELTPGIRYAFLIGLLLAFFNNWTGWSVMGGYITMLIESSGLNDRALAILQYAVSYGFMGVVTLVACWIVDRAGRRPLWLGASALMCVIMALTGAVFHFQLSGWIVLLVIILCTVPHGLALGPLPWLMMSELFPTRLRGRAVSLNTAFLWVTIYSGAQLFPIISDYSNRKIGSIGGTFWLLSAICVLAFLFGLFMLPETKGRTLEEIAASWKRK